MKEIYSCDELPCVDVGVGVIHHPYCGLEKGSEDDWGPVSPEEEEVIASVHPDNTSS